MLYPDRVCSVRPGRRGAGHHGGRGRYLLVQVPLPARREGGAEGARARAGQTTANHEEIQDSFLFTVFSMDIYHAKYYGGGGKNKVTLKKGEKALKMHLFGL